MDGLQGCSLWLDLDAEIYFSCCPAARLSFSQSKLFRTVPAASLSQPVLFRTAQVISFGHPVLHWRFKSPRSAPVIQHSVAATNAVEVVRYPLRVPFWGPYKISRMGVGPQIFISGTLRGLIFTYPGPGPCTSILDLQL